MSTVERVVQFIAAIIGIGLFIAGLINAYLSNQTIAVAASEAIGDINVSQRLADNLLVKLIMFSVLDMTLAFVAAILILCARSYLSIFAVVMVPAVLGASYLSSVMLLDIIFYGGTLGGRLDQLDSRSVLAIVTLAWPMALSIVYELIAFAKQDSDLGAAEVLLDENAYSPRTTSTLQEAAKSSLGKVIPGLKSCFGVKYYEDLRIITGLVLAHLLVCILAVWTY